jgi:dTDP-glucose 4,6-dehydratase
LAILGKSESLITYVTDRPGHDFRYAIDNTKIRSELGWAPEHTFETALRQTVEWYASNIEWCDGVRSGAYMEYYEKQYGQRLG